MKKRMIGLALVLCLMFGLATTGLAASTVGFHALFVEYDASLGALEVTGYFHNEGSTVITNVHNMSLTVYDATGDCIADVTFSDNGLKAIELHPGNYQPWRFRIRGVAQPDLSDWQVDHTFYYYDREEVDVGSGIKVFYEGEKIAFDVPPQIINGRTMVPLRAIFETMGADIEWDDATKTVTATRGDRVIRLTVGSDVAYVNGEAVTLDVPSQIVDSRTLVPVRFIAEAFGCMVQWGEADQIVGIYEW